MSQMKKALCLLCAAAIIVGTVLSQKYTYGVRADNEDYRLQEALDVSGSDVSGNEESPFTEEDLRMIEMARKELQKLLKDRTVMALVYLADELPVRREASEDSAAVVTVPSGQQVQIQDVVIDNAMEAWEYVTFYYQGALYDGYIKRSNLACSDEVFLAWEQEYGMNPAAYSVMTLDGVALANYGDIDQFPESYRSALKALKDAHPNWTFVKMNTNLEWNEVVQNEMVRGRNLIPLSYPSYMQDGQYGNSNWAYITEDALKYYLDPRNGLNEDWIFEFEQLTYNASYHTESAVQSFLNNTFMAGTVPGTVLSYAKTFWAIGAELGVSPFHLACRVYQEQGNGTSPLISGTYPGYEGYYNHFNIKASGKTNEEVIRNGLQYAKEQGWYNGYYSIYGGSKVISANYILKGQDTLYLQKFDVDASYNGLYYHQYMQNVCAPTSEGKNIRKLYNNAGSLENTFVFKIPVYNNMPAQACPKPTREPQATTAFMITPPAGYTDPTIYLDGIAYSAVSAQGNFSVDPGSKDFKTAVMYKYDADGVAEGMYVWELSYDGTQYIATPIPEFEDLLSYEGFSIRLTGKTGMRMKTGISIELRKKLIQENIAGYTLKEYGTLIMAEEDRKNYPMIKDGNKVSKGMTYGYTSSGEFKDLVLETVGDRYRFAAVLVGMPSDYYKVKYAFRSYIVLSKNGNDVILYGSPVARTLYRLAEKFIASGAYPEDTSAGQFLRSIITDGDAAVSEAALAEKTEE